MFNRMNKFFVFEQDGKWAKTGTRFKSKNATGYPHPDIVKAAESKKGCPIKNRLSIAPQLSRKSQVSVNVFRTQDTWGQEKQLEGREREEGGGMRQSSGGGGKVGAEKRERKRERENKDIQHAKDHIFCLPAPPSPGVIVGGVKLDDNILFQEAELSVHACAKSLEAEAHV